MNKTLLYFVQWDLLRVLYANVRKKMPFLLLQMSLDNFTTTSFKGKKFKKYFLGAKNLNNRKTLKTWCTKFWEHQRLSGCSFSYFYTTIIYSPVTLAFMATLKSHKFCVFGPIHTAVLGTIAYFTYSFFSVPFFISRDIEQAWVWYYLKDSDINFL